MRNKETEQVLDLIDTIKAGINLNEIKQWYQEDDILDEDEEQWKTIPTKYFPDTDRGQLEKDESEIDAHYKVDSDPVTIATQYVLQFTLAGSYKRRVAMELVTSLILFNMSEYNEHDKKIIPLVKTDYYYKSPYAKNKDAIIRSPINFIRNLLAVGVLENEAKLNKCATLFGDRICKVIG